ncbi:MAG: hypothetical protein KBS83_01915 [Lachnospiraceae bacterium]|nr:hypothetical protein [Candidatus Equihabitans merdae]
MANVLESLMLVCFGLSWPFNLHKLLVSKSTKGVSFFFYILIDIGYACGVLAKVVKYTQGISTPFYLIAVYAVNMIMVTTCIVLYLRYRKLGQ